MTERMMGTPGARADHPPADLTVLSFGAGTQSTALLLAAVRGDLPDGYAPPDMAVFADTGDEPDEVYRWLEIVQDRVLAGSSVALEVITPDEPLGTYTTDIDSDHALGIPAFIADRPGHVTGMARRQCTAQYKVKPVRRAISRELVRRDLTKRPGVVDLYMGISMDEAVRMKDSRVAYIVNRYPLIDLRWRRGDSIAYVREHLGEDPPRSACVFCPYKSPREWARLRDTDHEGWERAVAFDTELREANRAMHASDEHRDGYRGDLFIHRSGVPLEDAVLIPEDAGQLALLDGSDGFGNDCEGGCGL